jgi:DNA uptake protein ComE-like DNA-binding protein
MSRRLYREFYLLPRGEQRGLIVLCLLLILSLICRVAVQLLPEREPEGMEEFVEEARRMMDPLHVADSLQGTGTVSPGPYPEKTAPGSYPGRTVPGPVAHFSGQPARRNGPVDLNRADSAQLLPLPGIGPVFAGRIIRYRDLLGGYTSVSQLSEVYGLTQETIERISGRLVIDTSAVRKLELNRATFRELLRHPYLEYNDVKSLVSFRDFRDTIQSFRELQENHILPDSLLLKMRPYLCF